MYVPDSYIDIPRIFTALAEWGACMIFCLIRPRRMGNMKFVLVSAGVLAGLSAFLVLTDDVPLFLWLPCMIAAFCIMFAFIRSSVVSSRRNCLHFTIRAFLLAEFAASLEWQITLFGESTIKHSLFGEIVTLIWVYALIGFLAYKLEKATGTDRELPEYSKRDIISAALITILTFTVSNLSFIFPHTPFTTENASDILILRTIADFGGLAVLYAFQSRINEMYAANEMSRMSKELTAQYEGYRNYQEMIGLINFKYHDLKHQIAGLLAETNPEKREQALYEMQGDLERYRPEHITGNQVLDTILAGKSIRIKQSGIRFTCVADGALLSRIHVSDICSIFGNALDNAIEYEALLSDPSKRLIHLTVAERQGYIFIECANYCDEEMVFRDGLPVTVKNDRKVHGYGVKSIVYSVSKYNGSATFRQRDGMFTMQILIPNR